MLNCEAQKSQVSERTQLCGRLICAKLAFPLSLANRTFILARNLDHFGTVRGDLHFKFGGEAAEVFLPPEIADLVFTRAEAEIGPGDGDSGRAVGADVEKADGF